MWRIVPLVVRPDRSGDVGAPGDIDDIGGGIDEQEPAQFADLGVDLVRGGLAAAGATGGAGSGLASGN